VAKALTVHVLGFRDVVPEGMPLIDTTSRSRNWSRGLSPFLLGPVPLYPSAPISHAQNVENAWQYSKVYAGYVDKDGKPTQQYWDWATKGWHDKRAQRYPMGKGSKPLFSWWEGEALGYIEARKKIYIQLYAPAVYESAAFQQLKELYAEHGEIALRDFDGYDYIKRGMTLKDVVNEPREKMGHAFVLAILLMGRKGR